VSEERYKVEITKLTEEVTVYKEQITSRDKDISQLNSEIERLRQQITDYQQYSYVRHNVTRLNRHYTCTVMLSDCRSWNTLISGCIKFMRHSFLINVKKLHCVSKNDTNLKQYSSKL